ncbi:MAG TPA: IPT/TIG domain-containing protein [Acidimicrobiales bacterium]|nr:IPT/TIG domain-containing protein [Acidimicrobiales bacterium]
MAASAASLIAVGTLAVVPAGAASAGSARSAAGNAAPHTSTPIFSRIGRAASLPKGARLGTAVPAATAMTVDVALQPRDPVGLAAAAAQVASPRSPLHRHYMTSAQVVSLFAPSSTTVVAVEGALEAEGLHVVGSEASGMVLVLRGTAGTFATAFRTQLRAVTLPDGSIGRLATSAPAFPATIAPEIAGVVGLDALGKPVALGLHPPTRALPASAASSSGSSATTASTSPSASAPTAPATSVTARSGTRLAKAAAAGGPGSCAGADQAALAFAGYTPAQVAKAYGFDGLYSAGDVGGGQTVDIFELEPFAMTDIAAFDQCLFGSSHTSQITVVPVDNPNTTGYGSGEAALDVEEVSALAPGAHLDVYEAPQTFLSWLDEIAAMVAQDHAPVVSTSWGLCETQMSEVSPGFPQIENVFFEEAALEGQSWFAASGDSGSEGCYRNDPYNTSLSVGDPASQPFVTGVGGTEILDPTDPPREVVWNDGGLVGVSTEGAGGGGISGLWPMAPWQSGPGVPGVANAYSSGTPCSAATGVDCREVPDVSANADEFHGDIIFYGGAFGTIGGTSAAAPKWAAAAAVTNADCATAHIAPVGFANPALYEIASNPNSYSEGFNDITEGNNDNIGAHGGAYPATTGYDMATGLGTPRLTSPTGGAGLASLLCSDGTALTPRPVLTGVSPDFGPYQGGTAVTITGTDLLGVTAVSFGTSTVHVTAGEINGAGTQISVTTPSSPLAPVLGGVPVGGTLVTVSGSTPSEPTPSAEFHFVNETAPTTPVPEVSFVGPTAGPSAGGTTVVIVGSGFEEGPYTSGTKPTVAFGGVAVPAAGVSVLSDSELSVVVPAETGSTSCATAPAVAKTVICQSEVTVSNANGTSAVAPIYPAPSGPTNVNPPPGTEFVAAATEFDYAPPPTLSSVSPDVLASQPVTFGTPPPLVTLTGSGFDYLTLQAVTFGTPGSAEATSNFGLYSIEPGELQVVYFGLNGFTSVPSFPVAVTTAGGTTSAVTVQTAVVPTLSTIDLNQGPTTGGTVVNATGSGFDAVTQMEFFPEFAIGIGTPAGTSDITVHSDTSLTFVTPAALAGSGTWAACDSAGCSFAFVPYEYFEPVAPAIQGFLPTGGPAAGATTVTIVGVGLDEIQSVRFGGLQAIWYQLIPGAEPDNSIEAITPPGVAGTTVPISVVTSVGIATSTSTYTYVKSPPSPPQAVTAVGGGGSIGVHWIQPASDGGSPLLGYIVKASPQIGSAVTILTGPGANAATFTADPDTPYAVSVTAVTSLGMTSVAVADVVAYFGDNGYVVASAAGGIAGFGSLGATPSGVAGRALPGRIVGLAPSSGSGGYWLAGADGSVYPVGTAPQLGSMAGHHLTAPIVGIASTPDGGGYWLVASDGGVFTFGNAKYHGSTGNRRLNKPIVGIAPTTSGGGYWLVSSDGGIFTFGDARFHGSLGGTTLNSPIVAALPSSSGYWLVASDGGVFTFGNARFHGSLAGTHLPAPIVAAVATPDRLGYWLLGQDGAVYGLGSAKGEGGSQRVLVAPAAGIAT